MTKAKKSKKVTVEELMDAHLELKASEEGEQSAVGRREIAEEEWNKMVRKAAAITIKKFLVLKDEQRKEWVTTAGDESDS